MVGLGDIFVRLCKFSGVIALLFYLNYRYTVDSPEAGERKVPNV